VAGVSSEADGYNRRKTPSGRVVQGVSGQQIEFFTGVHIPQRALKNGRVLWHGGEADSVAR
jgi:hypothetical protein